ncbi:hypothetical protein CSOJ01_11649 [Colletotrichum sojae]|uniref:Uncharacterized protein n=1 Tax=Colletotrichum sojae TaxID=2175907 RepID=A0A8H6MNJ6_9PEZI|nr:hypothetical protein CSOJ01_11649 [Colletotrichum sojae]
MEVPIRTRAQGHKTQGLVVTAFDLATPGFLQRRWYLPPTCRSPLFSEEYGASRQSHWTQAAGHRKPGARMECSHPPIHTPKTDRAPLDAPCWTAHLPSNVGVAPSPAQARPLAAPTQLSGLEWATAHSTQHTARSTQAASSRLDNRNQTFRDRKLTLPPNQSVRLTKGTKRRGRTDARPIPNASPVLARASVYAFAGVPTRGFCLLPQLRLSLGRRDAMQNPAFVLNAPPRIWLVVASPVDFGSDAEHLQPSSVRRVGTGPKANCTGLSRRKP